MQYKRWLKEKNKQLQEQKRLMELKEQDLRATEKFMRTEKSCKNCDRYDRCAGLEQYKYPNGNSRYSDALANYCDNYNEKQQLDNTVKKHADNNFHKPTRNIDKIRKMKRKELAEWLAVTVGEARSDCELCPLYKGDYCADNVDCTDILADKHVWNRWLKQTVESEM